MPLHNNVMQILPSAAVDGFNIKYLGPVLKILRCQIKQYRLPIVSLVSDCSYRDPFLVLISCILSLRTQDKTTSLATQRLFRLATTPYEMLRLSKKKIEEAIYPVGFYRVKTSNIKAISSDLIYKFKGKVPDTIEELLSLKGVGRKTANLVLTEGFDKLAICVDTHVHRISNRLGLVRTNTPEETELSLRKILPKRYWKEYNCILVAYGQNVCKPLRPLCFDCRINRYCLKIGVQPKFFPGRFYHCEENC